MAETSEGRAGYERDGFRIVRGAIPEAEFQSLTARIADAIAHDGPTEDAMLHRHADARAVYELARHPAVTDQLAELLGEDIMLWHSRVFDKPPGAPEVPWHQDMAFWPLEPDTCVSAWISLDGADEENGCMWMIPGSHKTRLPTEKTDAHGRFGIKVQLSDEMRAAAVPIVLAPGDFVVFDRWIVHHSPVNASGRQRQGLAGRYIPASVKVDFDEMSTAWADMGVVNVRGSAETSASRVMAPPQAEHLVGPRPAPKAPPRQGLLGRIKRKIGLDA